MKKISLSLMVMSLFTAFIFSSCKQESTAVEETVEVVESTDATVSGDFTANVDDSNFAWLGTKVTGEHYGSINLQQATFSLEENVLTKGDVIIDMTTIIVEDIEDAEYNAKLKGHLESEDFFNTAEFPTANLLVTSADKGTATGDLTIKGITQPVTFEYVVTDGGVSFNIEGTMLVDRTLYDIKYGSGKFFDDLGDKTISDEFVLTFNISAMK